MSRCPKCHNSPVTGGQFCSRCGARVDSADAGSNLVSFARFCTVGSDWLYEKLARSAVSWACRQPNTWQRMLGYLLVGYYLLTLLSISVAVWIYVWIALGMWRLIRAVFTPRPRELLDVTVIVRKR